MADKYEKIVVVGDYHVPFEDKQACRAFDKFLKDFKPDTLIINGDFLDFYDLSKFDKDYKKEHKLQEELDRGYEILYNYRAMLPKTKIFMTTSNHMEKRLEKFKRGEGKAIASLDCLTTVEMLNLEELDIKLVPAYQNRHFMVMHGDIARKHSGYTAKGTLDNKGKSVFIGHCFDDKTEILTRRGWINGLDLNMYDFVGTMNKKTREFEWNCVEQIHMHDDFKELIHIKSITNDIMVTDKHGMVLIDDKNKLIECHADKLLTPTNKKLSIPNACLDNINEPVIDPVLTSLLIQIVTDGSISSNKVRWHLKKERKIHRLKQLLDIYGIEYKSRKTLTGTTKISAHFGTKFLNKWFPDGKRLYEWIFDCDRDVVLGEYAITDGCKNSSAKNSYQISSSKEIEIDMLQQFFVTKGFRATKNKRIDDRVNPSFILTVNTRDKTRITSNNVNAVEYDGKVWCATVKNGTLIIRRNGKVSITQNCHRMGAHYKTDELGTRVGVEGGCMCKLKPEYIEGTPNWQQGFTVIYRKNKGNWFQHMLVKITNGKFMFDGKLYNGVGIK